eukprot:TRINITY_DN2944_c0_g1_i13.p1 TRINITY_DN2944_c0_g1~~TRINITY_DN2944_c0_g1_i13.p1  ORF type:complete len:694 (-),score=168.92 TRINITY_DN2944_c0_g1_i13:165-2246(-)
MFIHSDKEGHIGLQSSENGEAIFSLKREVAAHFLAWIPFVNTCYKDTPSLLPKSGDTEKLIYPTSAHVHSNKNNLRKLQFLQNLAQTPMMLLIGDLSAAIAFSWNGLIDLGGFRLDSHIKESSYQIDSMLWDRNLLRIWVAGQTESRRYLTALDTKAFAVHKSDINKIGYIFSTIQELIDYSRSSFTSFNAYLKEINKSFTSKVGILDDLLKEAKISNPVNAELLKFFLSGACPVPLKQYFTKELFDQKILQKMDENITIGFNNLHETLLESFQNSIERLLVCISHLKGLSPLVGDGDSSLGLLRRDLLDKLHESLRAFLLRSEEALILITEAKADIRNFIIWLNKCVSKSTAEAEMEIEGTKNPLSKIPVDVGRLHDFLRDEDRFYFRYLQSCFSDAVFGRIEGRVSNYLVENREKRADELTKMTEDGKERTIGAFGEDSARAAIFESLKQNKFKPKTLTPPKSVMEQVRLVSIPGKEKKSEAMVVEGKKSNLLESFRMTEAAWTAILGDFRQRLSECVSPLFDIDLGEHLPNAKFAVSTPQDAVGGQDEQLLAFDYQREGIPLLVVLSFDTSRLAAKEILFNVASFRVPEGLFLRDCCISHENKVLLLVSTADQRSFIAELESPQQWTTSALTGGRLAIDSLFDGRSTLEAHEMSFAKVLPIETGNVRLLRANNKGLLSAIVDENKLIVFE